MRHKREEENDEEIRQDITSTRQNLPFFPFDDMNAWLQLKALRSLQ